MPVYIAIGLSALIWSLYPLGLAMGIKTMTTFEMLLVMYIIAMCGSLLTGVLYLYKRKLLTSSISIVKNLPRKGYYAILAGGLTTALCHGLFILALGMANKAGVSLLYESWPIMAVIMSPFLMQKTWKEVSLKEFIVSLTALIGIAIIVFSDKEVDFSITPSLNQGFDYVALSGYILAFIGAYLCALSVVTKGMASEYFNSLNDDIGSSLISEITTRTISTVMIIIAFAILGDGLNFDQINWYASFYVGFVVMVVGGALYTYALLKTDQPTIHIIYYCVPVLAVIWLWLAGESTLNLGLFIGGGIILCANIYLVMAGRKAPFNEAPSKGL